MARNIDKTRHLIVLIGLISGTFIFLNVFVLLTLKRFWFGMKLIVNSLPADES